MSLKFNIQVNKQAVQEALDSRPTGRYEGPTPNPGVYRFKFDRLWAGKNRDGTEVLIASLVIDEEGENATYNGLSILHRLTIPMDTSHQYFDVQIRSMDDFFKAISDGKYDVSNFIEDASAGKIADGGEDDKIGTPIKSIGKLKIGEPRSLYAKTKNVESNGNTYVNVHYIDLRKSLENVEPEESTDSPWGSDDDDDDLDDILGGI